jgi:hypothetical protein
VANAWTSPGPSRWNHADVLTVPTIPHPGSTVLQGPQSERGPTVGGCDDLHRPRRPPPPPDGSRAPGRGSIWRDPHVQQQLLLAHLDDSLDAATRVPATVEATVEWLVDGLPPGDAVLDLGCGPGLYAQRLADRGFEVTGVDLNAASIV